MVSPVAKSKPGRKTVNPKIVKLDIVSIFGDLLKKYLNKAAPKIDPIAVKLIIDPNVSADIPASFRNRARSGSYKLSTKVCTIAMANEIRKVTLFFIRGRRAEIFRMEEFVDFFGIVSIIWLRIRIVTNKPIADKAQERANPSEGKYRVVRAAPNSGAITFVVWSMIVKMRALSTSCSLDSIDLIMTCSAGWLPRLDIPFANISAINM